MVVAAVGVSTAAVPEVGALRAGVRPRELFESPSLSELSWSAVVVAVVVVVVAVVVVLVGVVLVVGLFVGVVVGVCLDTDTSSVQPLTNSSVCLLNVVNTVLDVERTSTMKIS